MADITLPGSFVDALNAWNTPPKPAAPQMSPADQLAADVAQINGALSSPDAMGMFTLSKERENGLTADNQLVKDYSELTPIQFETKYGTDVYQKMVATGIGGQHVKRLAATQRSPLTHMADDAIGVVSGAAQGALGLLAGIHMINPFPYNKAIGRSIAEAADSVGEFARSMQSDELNRLRYVDSLRGELDRQDNNQAYEDDEGSKLMSSIRAIGRDVLSGTRRFAEDPAMLETAVAEGVGSLLVGGPAAKGIKGAGKIANEMVERASSRLAPAVEDVGSRAVQEALNKAAFPLAIGAMEGGSNYNQSLTEVLNTPLEVLAEQSLRFNEMVQGGMSPEAAREQLADETARVAGAISAPVGALTGKLVQRFETSPLTGVRALPGNAAREFVEEGIQSGAGEFAGNVGERASGVDPNGNLVEGVGSAAIQGALAGAGTAGVIQGPSLALTEAAKAAGLVLQKGATKLRERGERILAKAEAETSVSEQNLAPAVAEATVQAPEVAADLRTLATEAGASEPDVEAFIARVEQASKVAPQELSELPANLVPEFQIMDGETIREPNRLEALALAAGIAMNEERDQADRVAAGAFLIKQIEDNRKLFSEDYPAFMDNVPHDRPEFQKFQAYGGILQAIEQTPSIVKAMDWARTEMKMPEADITGVDLNTPEGQGIVNTAVNVAMVAPMALDINQADHILKQADEGIFSLAPERRRVLRGARSLLNSARIYNAQLRTVEPIALDEQATELDQELESTEARDEQIKFVNRQIETTGGSKAHQLSLVQHVEGINRAASAGDMNTARQRVIQLSMFARSMRNKVAAFNTAIQNGDRKKVPYSALGSDGKMLPADGYFSVFYNPGSAPSERLARQVYAEAVATAQLANDMAAQYPEFGVSQVSVPALRIMSENPVENQDIKKGEKGSSPSPEPSTETQATTSRSEDKVQKEELPSPPPQPIREAEVKAPVGETIAPASTDQAEAQRPNTSSPEEGTQAAPDALKAEEKTEVVVEVPAQDTSPDPVTAEIVDAIETVEDGPEELTTAEAFPSLVQAKGKNWFQKAFRLPREAKSRLMRLEAPLEGMKQLVRDRTKRILFMDRDLPYDVNVDQQAALEQFLGKGDQVLATMKQRLKDRVTSKSSDGSSILDKLVAGDEMPLRTRELRALNILDRTEKGFRYNPQLVQSAILAGLDWVLNAQARSLPLDAADVAELMGIPEADAEAYVNDFNRGISADMAARTLAQSIRKVWGVEAAKDASYVFTDGIPEAVAKEVLHGLAEAGLLAMGKIQAPGATKEFNRVVFDTRSQEDEGLIQSLDRVKKLIGDLALIEREVEGYSIGEPVTEIDETQLRNPILKTTRMQKRALENVQKTAYLPNLPMFDLVQAMGEEQFVTLMSGRPYKKGDLEKSHKDVGLNVKHWESVKGVQRGYASSYRNVVSQMEEVRAHAEKKGVPVEQMPTYYKHHIQKLGRIQMGGLSNPQSDKLAREVFMATRSTIDLSNQNSPQFASFLLTVGQGIGLKTEKESTAAIAEQVQKDVLAEDGKLRPIVNSLKIWLENRENGNGKLLPSELSAQLQEAGLSMHGMHSLVAVARYELDASRGADLTKFETFNYLEADGKTNGPINALMLLTAGAFKKEWLRLVGKGGVFIGHRGKTLDQHPDKDDLYQEGANRTQKILEELEKDIPADNKAMHAQLQAFKTVASGLSDNLSLDEDGNLTIKRGLTKNPLTITIYGSGVDGIVGKVTKELVNTLYEQMSAGVQAGANSVRISEELNRLVAFKPFKSAKTGKYYLRDSDAASLSDDPREFAFDAQQLEALEANVKMFLVGPMAKAIDQIVEDQVGGTTSVIQEATQLQSIIAKGLYLNEITALIAQKQSQGESDDYRKGEFISREENEKILENVHRFSPIIDTGTQRYSMSGSERSDLFETTRISVGPGKTVDVSMPEAYSSDLFGKLRTAAYVFAPSLAGVRAIPTTVVGSGDGQMQLNVMADNPRLASRSTQVFDGLNMPIDAMTEFSRAINESVFKTWTTDANPVRAIANQYRAFLELDPIGTLFPDGVQNDQQKQALLELTETVLGKDNATEATANLGLAKRFMELKLEQLENLADETDARRKAMSEVLFSVDQMASAKSSFVNEGAASSSLDPGAIVRLLNERYEAAKAEMLRKRESDRDAQASAVEPADPRIEQLVADLAFQDETGARVFEGKGVQSFLRSLTDILNPTQKEMVRAAIQHLEGTDYRLVFGDYAQLDAWEEVYNADDFQPNTTDIYGKIDTKNKIILIQNASAETIVHELIHAATIDKVRAAYERPEVLSETDRKAVERIDALMVEWLTQEYDAEAQLRWKPRQSAESAVRTHLRNGRRFAAVNEFMAWVLASQDLAKIASKTRINRVFDLIGDALAALKTLIWGAPNKGPRVGDNLLSQLRFNTRVLMAPKSRIEMLVEDDRALVMHQSASFGRNNRLQELRARFSRKIVQTLGEPATDAASQLARDQKQSKIDRALDSTDQLARLFAFHFPGMGDMLGMSTFRAIQVAMMVETELNANSLERINELYAFAMEKLDVSSFRQNEDPNDQNDIRQAQDKLNALQGVFGTVTDEFGRSSLMSSFLALAMVDDSFRQILARLEKDYQWANDKPGLFTFSGPNMRQTQKKGLDWLLENTANKLMDSLSLKMSGSSKKDRNVQEALDTLVAALMANVGDQRAYMEQEVENGISGLEKRLADAIQAGSEKVVQATRQVQQTSQNSLVRLGAGVANLAATMINEQRAEEAQLGMVSWLNRRGGLEGIRALVNDMVGLNRENAPVFQMISKVRAYVQQTRQQFREELPRKLNNAFRRTLTASDWTSMFNALGRTDFAALAEAFGLAGAMELLASPRRVTSEIQTLERSIAAREPARAPTIQAKAKQLAHFMMTGEHGVRLLRNAEAIARLLGEPGLASGAVPDAQLVSEIDRLVSLYAIQEIDPESRATVLRLIQEEGEGLEFVTSYLMGQRKDELAKIGGNRTALLNHYKGNLPSEAQNRGTLRVVSESDHVKMVSRGYVKLGQYHGSSADRTLGRRFYYFSPVSGLAPFSQGVLQTVHQTVSGIDPNNGYTVDETMAGRIEDPALVRLIQRQLANQQITNENLLPVFDENGATIAFERAIDPAMTARLNRSTDLAKMIGAWRGRQAEELLANQVNEQLVDNLYDIWTQGQRERRTNEFVNIFRLDPTKDPVLAEAVRLIPKQTIAYIREKFDGESFMVRRDMLLDTFGARQASVGDLFTGKTRWNPRAVEEFEKIAVGILGLGAYKYLVGAEKNVQELVSNVKHLIVVKSVIVPAANIVSNMFQLLARGVPLRDIVKGAGAKTAEINAYIKKQARKVDLEADLRAARAKNDLVAMRKLETEIRSIDDSYRRMSIWPLIEAGEFSAISSGQVTAEDLALADGKWTDWVERKVATLPDGLRTIARYGLITRDTALYQGLARSVQYGDFVAKAILYDDLSKRKKMGRQDAINMVSEAFVNYNRLAGRSRQYLESTGLLWFYNYKLRIMKEAAYMLRHNPLRSLLTTAIPALPLIGSIGTPVTDNMLSIMSDGRLEYSIGPGMGMGAFSLNPWVNLAR